MYTISYNIHLLRLLYYIYPKINNIPYFIAFFVKKISFRKKANYLLAYVAHSLPDHQTAFAPFVRAFSCVLRRYQGIGYVLYSFRFLRPYVGRKTVKRSFLSVLRPCQGRFARPCMFWP